MSANKNFIAGSWIESDTETENIYPSEISDVVGACPV